MKLRLAFVGAVVAITVACAGQGEAPGGGDPFVDPDGGGRVPGPSDAGTDADVAVDAPVLPRCSKDGWCATEVPEPAPHFEDLWPLTTTAFAVGNGIFEFDGTRWAYVNDRVSELVAVWAPNTDEVWAGGRYGRMLHGVRASGVWAWTEENVGTSEPIRSLWGSGSNDVYAVAVTRAYHRVPAPDGGAQWQVEVEDQATPDPFDSNRLTLSRVSGSGPDDVWISGKRGELCSYVSHKTGGAHVTVADCASVCSDDSGCTVEATPPALLDMWSPVLVVDPQRAIALKSDQVVRIARNADAGYDLASQQVSGLFGESFWGATETDLYTAGYGQVRHNANIEADGGTFELSSIALSSVPLDADFKVRGTSSTNVWAFGGPYALRRTKF